MSTINPTSDGGETTQNRAWREWLAIGEGLTALLSVCAIIISFVALSNSSSGTPASAAPTAGSVSTMPMGSNGAATPAAAATPAVAPQSVSMSFKADDEHAKKGPDGTWHDAALPAIYTVHAGAVVTVTLYNYDGSPHSFTAPSLGVDQVVPSGSITNPSQVTVKFTAPAKAGRYEWWCKFPCDPWAMTHNGYMRGYVTVQA